MPNGVKFDKTYIRDKFNSYKSIPKVNFITNFNNKKFVKKRCLNIYHDILIKLTLKKCFIDNPKKNGNPTVKGFPSTLIDFI